MKTIILDLNEKVISEMNGIISLDGVGHIKHDGRFYDIDNSVYSTEKGILFIFVTVSFSVQVSVYVCKAL